MNNSAKLGIKPNQVLKLPDYDVSKRMFTIKFLEKSIEIRRTPKNMDRGDKAIAKTASFGNEETGSYLQSANTLLLNASVPRQGNCHSSK